MPETLMRPVWSALFWTVPPLFAIQVCVLAWLLWRGVFRWRPHAVGAGRFQRWCLGIGAFLAPIVMLIESAAVSAGYQGERGGHWFFHMHSGWAGLALVPVFAAGSIGAALALSRGTYRHSTTWLVVLLTLAAICAWYTYATAFLGMGDDKSIDLDFTAVIPAVAGTNYALLALDAWRHRERKPADALALVTWFVALGVSLAAKIPLAQRLYDSLPESRPDGYGDCFVVSAAARGHPAWVGSRLDPRLGRAVNRQLETLWAFENALAERCPRWHRVLRRLYNGAGPVVARYIRCALVADVVYLLLKPVEWLALMLLVVLRR